MKSIKIGEKEIKVCEHQGDIAYLRFVKFKQWAPQFWEKMDSPLFTVYFERFMDYHNQGKHAQALMVLHDYKLAIDNCKNSYDAWGICFALIAVEDGEDFRNCPDDSELKKKIERLTKEGLTADVVRQEVLNFMSASPEVFGDHLSLYAIASMPNTIGS
jgi:hypothetical protein